ncbi:MAG: ribonuclease PH [Myxococcales bacterium]|nr:ribonuclease PH [Myxococcales bacterium]MDH3483350.1 ribonuclease PH [Myxococcales bacterium]
MTRTDGRAYDMLRPVSIEPNVQRNPEGSVLYRCGDTTVLIAASVAEGVPDWMRGSGQGWLTAEYAMHPRANPDRKRRDGRNGRIDGRTSEIQRLVGRALRAAIDFDKLGERTITVDCDVLDADGGTRTASITGGMVATAIALDKLRATGLVRKGVLRESISAISVGLLEGRPMLDLCYVEDRDAAVDLNVVGTPNGGVVEVQGTAEGAPIAREQLDQMIDLALGSLPALAEQQAQALRVLEIDIDRLLP